MFKIRAPWPAGRKSHSQHYDLLQAIGKRVHVAGVYEDSLTHAGMDT
jgi:hypothetical protein